MVDNCAWKSGINLIPKDQIQSLISSLLAAEKKRWLSNISPVSSSEHDFGDESENRNSFPFDFGSILLRHGKIVTNIHRFFQSLEPGHYRLIVTAQKVKPDTLQNLMKVVSDDGNSQRFTSSSGSVPGSLSQSSDTQLTDKLQDAALELYKNAVLCAQYPKLSDPLTPTPDSPYSPSPSSPKSTMPLLHRRFSYSTAATTSFAGSDVQSRAYSRQFSSSSDAGCVSPEVSVAISAEDLRELVRNAFQLSKKAHLNYEKGIQGRLPKDPTKLLVEELQRQQLVLDQNYHPYYRVQAFMDGNAYDTWVLSEKGKIQGLIKSFWSNPVPSLPGLPLNMSSKHEEYVDLMGRLILLESKTKTVHPVHGGVTPSSPLSSKAWRLLKEFRLRYGVGEVFCKLSYLKYLVEHFENALWYIEHVMATLQELMDLVFTCPEIFVKSQFTTLLSLLSLLLLHTKYALTRIRRLFPENTPEGGVVALVSLFELTLDASVMLQSEFPAVFSRLHEAREFALSLPEGEHRDMLASYLRTEMEGRYERLKVVAADELREHFLSSSLSAQLLLKMIMNIQDEVNYYNTHYKRCFEKYFDVMEAAAVSFYSLLMADVERLCDNPPRSSGSDEVGLCMLNLGFRLSKLDQDWTKFIPVSLQMTWREPFQQFALDWLDVIGRNFQNLVSLTTSKDQWQAVEVNAYEPRERSAKESRENARAQGPKGSGEGRHPSLTPSLHSAFSVVNSSGDFTAKYNKTGRSGRNDKGKQPLPASASPKQKVLKRRRNSRSYTSSSDQDPIVKVQTVVASVRGQKGCSSLGTQRNLPSKVVQQVAVEVHLPRSEAAGNGDALNTAIDRPPEVGVVSYNEQNTSSAVQGNVMVNGVHQGGVAIHAPKTEAHGDENLDNTESHQPVVGVGMNNADVGTHGDIVCTPSYKTNENREMLGITTERIENAGGMGVTQGCIMPSGLRKSVNERDVLKCGDNGNNETDVRGHQRSDEDLIGSASKTVSPIYQPESSGEERGERRGCIDAVGQLDSSTVLEASSDATSVGENPEPAWLDVSVIRSRLSEQDTSKDTTPIQNVIVDTHVSEESSNKVVTLDQTVNHRGSTSSEQEKRDVILAHQRGTNDNTNEQYPIAGMYSVVVAEANRLVSRDSTDIAEHAPENNTEVVQRGSTLNTLRQNTGDASTNKEIQANGSGQNEVQVPSRSTVGQEYRAGDGVPLESARNVGLVKQSGHADHKNNNEDHVLQHPPLARPSACNSDVSEPEFAELSKKNFDNDNDTHPASVCRNQLTPFENDTYSDTDCSVNSSDSFDFIEDQWRRERLMMMIDNRNVGTLGAMNTQETALQPGLPEPSNADARLVPAIRGSAVAGIDEHARIATGPIEEIVHQKDPCGSCPSQQSCLKVAENRDSESRCGTKTRMGAIPKESASKGLSSGLLNSAPINIPKANGGQTNRHFLNAREAETNSLGTRTSECGSFVTAGTSPNSVSSLRFQSNAGMPDTCSRNSEESFHSANSDLSVLNSRKTRHRKESGNRFHRRRHVRELVKVLPISSSFVDVICAVQRLTAFACHLCKILCPEEVTARSDHAAASSATALEESRNLSLTVKRVLCNRLIQVLCGFIQLYSDNVMGLETCGVDEMVLTRVIGERLCRHLRTEREAGRVKGCRYNPSVKQCCNTYTSSGAFTLPCQRITETTVVPWGCEPLNKQMGIRVSNVLVLRELLPWLLDYVTSCMCNPDSLAPGGDSERSATYCQHGPSLDDATSNNRGDGSDPETIGFRDEVVLRTCGEHLCRLGRAQVALMTYRINQFFKRVLHTLLELKLPGCSMTRRLAPAVQFLSRELRNLHGVLYEESFQQLLTNCWTFVTLDFADELDHLVLKKSSASEHSELLLRAVAYLMDFFRGGDFGLKGDELAAPVEPTLKNLGFYTSSTDRLIAMYRTLSRQVLFMRQQYRADEFTSSTSSVSHQSRVTAPADAVIQDLCNDLHATRKCFTGTAFIDWVKDYTDENGFDNLGLCIGSTATETGLELGQYLLDRGFLVCVDTPPRLNRQSFSDRRAQSQQEDDDDREGYSSPQRGRVILDENASTDMKINNIAITNRTRTESPVESSRSSSRATGSNSCDTEDDADDERDDEEAFLDSIDDILQYGSSLQSERATFYNNPRAFYKFIGEEDTARSDLRFRQGISDRLNMSVILEQLLCVLYCRKEVDREAKSFLRSVPSQALADVVRRKREAALLCFSSPACRFRCPLWECQVN